MNYNQYKQMFEITLDTAFYMDIKKSKDLQKTAGLI
ncbi:hypothetical protein J2T04_001730 [Chryseobacterium lathyri]|uniref:Uncharacterized protein n=1 Tax=Chryseobacterium lathyri TaxID=395933 RepID=A0ABT9SK99_9FLAO|nr:hypothetical protein [Chryseobacterium lathyri]